MGDHRPRPPRSHARTARDVLVAVAAAVTVPLGSAEAQQYQGCQATVSELDVTPGETIIVTGSGAEPATVAPGALVSASMPDVIGSGYADRNGNFTFPAVVPGDLVAGSHLVTIDCANGATMITVVVGPTPPTGRPIPFTGSGTGVPIARIGVAVCAAGALAVAMSRRRRWAGE